MTKIETQAIHAGFTPDAATGAVSPPIHLSTTFERAADGSYPLGYHYSREANPNRTALEATLAQLEGGHAAAAFGSGSVATMTLLQALAPGDHVLTSGDLYHGVRKMLTEIFALWGLESTFVDMTNNAEIEEYLQANTRLILFETPTNPRLRVTDIAAVVAMAKAVEALVAVDNTIATPLNQRPLELGADIVIHATTKYLNGHSDVLGGALVTREPSELWDRIKMIQHIGGAVPSPFDCWLTLRGLQTFPYRVRAHNENALKVAQFLSDHPNVERVYYPGLPDDPGHAVAAQQMSDFGAVVSAQVKGDAAAALAVAERVRVFTRATSFGGAHSFIEHRASIEGEGTPTPQNLLRLSVGLENADDLIADLDAALRG